MAKIKKDFLCINLSWIKLPGLRQTKILEFSLLLPLPDLQYFNFRSLYSNKLGMLHIYVNIFIEHAPRQVAWRDYAHYLLGSLLFHEVR
jgi:hypothetical protein